MSSDTEIAFQFVAFVVRWLVGTVTSHPAAVLLALLCLLLLLVSWRLLTSAPGSKLPPALSSPWTSVPCLLLLAVTSAKLHATSSQMGEVRQQLEQAEWRIKQGAQHRISLLDQLEHQHSLSGHFGSNMSDKGGPNPLDGCLHVFIDLGSNRGLQIRKLYEPDTFPLAPVLPLYERFFGKPEDRRLQEICSVSFEPNSKHAAHLRQLSESYASCGITMVVYQAGVGHKNTKLKFAPFNQLLGQEVEHDASARLIHEEDGETMEAFAESHFHDTNVEVEEVEVVRFARFITDVVATRRLPNSAQADIEGAELKILPDMVMTGALQHVDNLHMEWHGEASYRTGPEPSKIDKLERAISVLAELTHSEGLEDKFEIIEMDDETYSGILIYKPWGDYTTLPMMTC